MIGSFRRDWMFTGADVSDRKWLASCRWAGGWKLFYVRRSICTELVVDPPQSSRLACCISVIHPSQPLKKKTLIPASWNLAGVIAKGGS